MDAQINEQLFAPILCVEPRRFSHVLPAQAAQILQQQGRKSKPIAQHLGISHI